MIFCWDQLLRSSVQFICWDYLLRSAVIIICWDRLLKLSVVIICCVQKASKNPWAYHQKQEKIKKPMSIAANANKVCKSIKKPMSIPSKTRKDQKAHEHSSNPCQKVLKPMSIAWKTQKIKPRPEPEQEEMLEWRPPALTNTPLSHAHTASPRPLARTHDTNTKRNRNQFPDWGSLASINSPQSPISEV